MEAALKSRKVCTFLKYRIWLVVCCLVVLLYRKLKLGCDYCGRLLVCSLYVYFELCTKYLSIQVTKCYPQRLI